MSAPQGGTAVPRGVQNSFFGNDRQGSKTASAVSPAITYTWCIFTAAINLFLFIFGKRSRRSKFGGGAFYIRSVRTRGIAAPCEHAARAFCRKRLYDGNEFRLPFLGISYYNPHNLLLTAIHCAEGEQGFLKTTQCVVLPCENSEHIIRANGDQSG